MSISVKLIKMWFISKWIKLLGLFGVVRSTSPIPKNTMYCYEVDEERNEKEPFNGYWIRTCPYYCKDYKTGYTLCKLDGYFGFDFGMYDQCKVCGINEGLEDFS